ncbi:hypothetical protein [Desulfonatronovibrio magnus]|uniref:hypothetical protein n=1 Tax=Desulfonatronovibrio magnus TaxID=698827 RepID=UPI0005EB9E1D|nr:hypothetical protein [Desulfonatronovibrio magnus]
MAWHGVCPEDYSPVQKSLDFTGQLEAYKHCLKEVSPLPAVSYLHYPVSGFVVGVEGNKSKF